MIPLFYSKKTKKYYAPVEKICQKCKLYTHNHIIIRASFLGRTEILDFFCSSCAEHANFSDKYFTQIKVMAAVSPPPADATPILSLRVGTQGCRNLSVCEAVTQSSERVINKTAFSESIEGAQIGSPDQDRLQELDNPLNKKSVAAYLDNLKDAVPEIEHKEIRQIPYIKTHKQRKKKTHKTHKVKKKCGIHSRKARKKKRT